MGQPSVSRRVHALEHQLGVSLLRRTTRQLFAERDDRGPRSVADLADVFPSAALLAFRD